MPAQFSYMVQQPDGSTSTLQSTADRPPTWGELSDHVASTGAQLLPATPAKQPPPPAASPAPAAAAPPADTGAAPAASAPSLVQRAGDVLVPNRTFGSQLPSIGGAVAGAEAGAGIGMLGGPAAVVTVPLGAIAGAALGSGAGEGLRLAYERSPLMQTAWNTLVYGPKANVAAPQVAEAASPGERIENAAIRGGVFEGAGNVVRLGVAAPVVHAMGAEAPAEAAPVMRAVKSLAEPLQGLALGAYYGHPLTGLALGAARQAPEIPAQCAGGNRERGTALATESGRDRGAAGDHAHAGRRASAWNAALALGDQLARAAARADRLALEDAAQAAGPLDVWRLGCRDVDDGCGQLVHVPISDPQNEHRGD